MKHSEMMKRRYAQAAMHDLIWDEETSQEELAEAEQCYLKRSIISIKTHRKYQTYDGKLVYIREFVLTDLFDELVDIGEGDLKVAYENALKNISSKVMMAGFDAPILEIPFVFKKGCEYPNRLQMVELVGKAIDGKYHESRLVITRVTDSFEGVIEKEISDIVEKLNWVDLSEDYHLTV